MAQDLPNVKDRTITGELSQPLKDFLKDLREKISKDDSDRENWMYKVMTARNQRLGIKRYTNEPYEGAPDIPLPESDKLIKKGTPNFVLSSWSPKKMCIVSVADGVQVTPQLKEKAHRSELVMNMILRKKINWFEKLELAADFAKESGFCLFRVVEKWEDRKIHKVIDLDDFEEEQVDQLKQLSNDGIRTFLVDRYGFDLEDKEDKREIDGVIKQFRSGESIIEFDVKDITSMPDVDIPLPTKVIVPSYTTDVTKANRITYEYFMTRREIEENINAEVFIKKDLDALDFSGKGREDTDLVESQKRRHEGVGDSNSTADLFRIHEVECWYQEEKDGPFARWVFTFLADILPAEEALLRRLPFPYEFDGWNYERFDNEKKDPRHYNSRGEPEMIRAVQDTMERSLNNMLIRDEMNNNPLYEVLDTSDILQRETFLKPGDMLPVKALGQEIRALHEPIKVDVSSDRIMQLLKAYVEEYRFLGDQLFRNATNAGGGKTLGEINLGLRNQSGPLNLDVIRWNETLSRVYKKMFLIMQERLDEPIFIEGVKVTREDFNFPAEVRSNGNLEISDKQLATQKAIARIQIVLQMVQSGVANVEDVYNAYRDWLEKDGVKDPDQFSTHPQEILQGKLAQMQQALQQMQLQAQQLQKANEDSQKDLAKTKEQTTTAVKNAQGQMEALVNAQ